MLTNVCFSWCPAAEGELLYVNFSDVFCKMVWSEYFSCIMREIVTSKLMFVCERENEVKCVCLTRDA